MTTEPMPDPLSRFIKDFPEMYEVVRTVIVVRHRRLYKVEVTCPPKFSPAKT